MEVEIYLNGEIFLPEEMWRQMQWKEAVEFLMKPEASGKRGGAAKVVLATVEADLHDIERDCCISNGGKRIRSN